MCSFTLSLIWAACVVYDAISKSLWLTKPSDLNTARVLLYDITEIRLSVED